MSYLAQVQACNTWEPSHFRPWYIDGARVGMLRHGFAENLRRWPEVFVVEQDAVRLLPRLAGFEDRSLALHRVVLELVQEGSVSHVHGEQYPVSEGPREEALCVVDRAAAPYFGIRAFGQHINGYVRDRNGIRMWIGRRASDRRHFPGKLDNLAAGGLPHGLSLRENLLKECWEEAGVPRGLAEGARPVGALAYVRETDKGLKPDTMYCYDLELPADFSPHCNDGEMSGYHLWPLDQVARTVRESDEFKLNCALVVIDFLIRHGALGPEEGDYLALAHGLHRVLTLESGAGGP